MITSYSSLSFILIFSTFILCKIIGIGPVNGHPDYIRNAIMQSLQRLKTDYIDLYTTRVDPNVPIEDTVSALADLVHKVWSLYLLL